MRRIVTRLNEKRVHAWIVYDLLVLDMLRCKPISQQRHTVELASVKTRDVAVANAETITMPTRIDQM